MAAREVLATAANLFESASTCSWPSMASTGYSGNLEARGGHAHCAKCRATQCGCALGDQVDKFQNRFGNCVEKFVQGDECRAFYVPVGLFDLAV